MMKIFIISFWISLLGSMHASAGGPIRIAMLSGIVPESLEQDYRIVVEVWSKKIMEDMGYYPKIFHYAKPNQFFNAIEKGEADVFSLKTENYISMNPETVIPIAFIQRYSSPASKYVLLSRNNESLKQLQGGEIKCGEDYSNTPALWLSQLVHKETGNSIGEFFRKITKVDSHKNAIYDVFFGRADACLVPLEALELVAELNPQLNESLHRVAVSDPFTSSVICMSAKSDPELVEAIKRNIIKLDSSPSGQQILNLLSSKKYCTFDEKYLEGVLKLFEYCKANDILAGNSGGSK